MSVAHGISCCDSGAIVTLDYCMSSAPYGFSAISHTNFRRSLHSSCCANKIRFADSRSIVRHIVLNDLGPSRLFRHHAYQADHKRYDDNQQSRVDVEWDNRRKTTRVEAV
jgi:hypothetical protein